VGRGRGQPLRLIPGGGPGAAARARAGRALRRALPLYSVDRQLVRLSFYLERLQGLDPGRLLERLVERLRDQDLVRARDRAQAARDVHRVADHGVLQPAVRADVAREHLAEVDADPDAQLGPALRLPPLF